MDAHGHTLDGSLIFDNLDVDLVIKVLAHTVFGPFFTFFIPVFFVFQGAQPTDPLVLSSGAYFVLISLYWGFKWLCVLYDNQGNLFFAPKKLDWGDQVVVITGGSSGIGGLLAETLAVRSVSVAVLDINPPQSDHYNITYYKCDVSKWAEVEAVAQKVKEELGEPTMIINNAGVVQGKLLTELSEEDINQTFGVNTLAHFWTLKAFLPSLIKQKKGHVVTIGSILGHAAVVRMADYCASKAAVISLHNSLRYELDKVYKTPEIRTSLILPGHVLTPLFKAIHFSSSPLRKFFMPSVAPVDVVKKIIQALDSQHSTHVIMPFYGETLPYSWILPKFLVDFSHWMTGSDESMEQFVKISGRRQEEGPAPIPSNGEAKKNI